jgi:hypothetical protein
MNSIDLGMFKRDRNWVVISILLVSVVLRGILIVRGGQYFNSDETRYEVSREAVRFLLQGQITEALQHFTLSPEHLGFKVAGMIPALLEHITGPSLALPAAFFSLFSVLNLYLIFLLSRHAPLSPSEPRYALFLAASCLSLLYYARHLFPYDMALSFGLLAFYAGLRGESNAEAAFVCGGLSFLCFITYNGYWPLAGFAVLTPILLNGKMNPAALQKALFAAAGFVAPLVLLSLGLRALGTDMLAKYRYFAASITQGSFEEGWSLPFEYFWHTEHFIILVMGILSVYAIAGMFRADHRLTGLWTGGAIVVYLCLLIPSTLLHSFVVYGRLARQILPFLILLAAQGLAQLEQHPRVRQTVVTGILILIALQAAWNFGSAYPLYFPRQFTEELQAQFPAFEFSTKRLAYGAPTLCRSNGYVIENAKFFLTAPEQNPPVDGMVLRDVLHAVNFAPYLYEGNTPEERREFRKHEIRMRLYRVDDEFASESNPAWTSIKKCIVPENRDGWLLHILAISE